MRTVSLLSGLASYGALASAYTFDSTPQTDALAAAASQNFIAYQYNDPTRASQSCAQQDIVVRREWNNFTQAEQQAYIAANQCMYTLPNKGDAPGARSRWDDFTATHQRQALVIHNTGMFLAWHRWFLASWENALRTECGYTGHQPYVDWAKIAHDPVGAPMFDGSMTSIGGNGQYVQHDSNTAAVPIHDITLPAGQGGGCVTTGPFTNYTINLGPRDSLAYNPRCLSRDLLQPVSSAALTDAKNAALISQNNNVVDFQNVMQGVGNNDFATWGVHASAHNTVAGVPGGDFWISSSEPWFWFLHGQIDRLWWIWQNQDPANRMNEVGGARSFPGQPDNGTTQPTDQLVLNTYSLYDRPLEEVLSTVQGGLCYVYA